MLDFEDIIIILIFGSIGLLMIALGIYLKIVDNKFKKNGIKLNFKVKSVKTENQLSQDGEILGEFYITTFEFMHNDILLEETIQTSKKYKVNSIMPGIYLPEAKLNKISVAGEGFHISSGVEKFLLGIGFSILFYITAALFDFSIKIVMGFTILVALFIFEKVFKLRKRNNNKK